MTEKLKYSQDYTVTFSYIDNRGITRPSAIADFMQDAATVHEKKLSIVTGKINGFWVLSRLKYRLLRPLTPYETVTVTTWCGAVKGPLWYRDFSFCVNGENVGTGTTAWVVLDRATHKIVRPSSIPGYMSFLPESNNPVELLSKIEPNSTDYSAYHTVSYSDIDINNHLNNVKVIDIISNALNLQKYENEFVSELQVNYLAESYSEDKLLINVSEKEKINIYAECEDGGSKRFEAEVIIIGNRSLYQ